MRAIFAFDSIESLIQVLPASPVTILNQLYFLLRLHDYINI